MSALIELVLLAGSRSWGLGTYLPTFCLLILGPTSHPQASRMAWDSSEQETSRKHQGNLSFVLSHAGMHYLDSLGSGTGGFATKRETGIDSVRRKYVQKTPLVGEEIYKTVEIQAQDWDTHEC